jgi:hypothetical protein
MEIAALQFDASEEGVNGDGPVFVNDLAGQWRSVVGEEIAVIVKILHYAAGVAGEGIPQAGLEPFG